jgi:hypothetical protein
VPRLEPSLTVIGPPQPVSLPPFTNWRVCSGCGGRRGVHGPPSSPPRAPCPPLLTSPCCHVADVVFMALHTLSIDLRAFVASEIVALSRELREHGDKGRDLTNIWLVRAHPQPISTHLNSSQLISTHLDSIPSPPITPSHLISSHLISGRRRAPRRPTAQGQARRHVRRLRLGDERQPRRGQVRPLHLT